MQTLTQVIGGLMCGVDLQTGVVVLVNCKGRTVLRALLSPLPPFMFTKTCCVLRPLDSATSTWFLAGLGMYFVFQTSNMTQHWYELRYALEPPGKHGDEALCCLTSWTVVLHAPVLALSPESVAAMQGLVECGAPGTVEYRSEDRKHIEAWWYRYALSMTLRYGNTLACTTPEDVAEALSEPCTSFKVVLLMEPAIEGTRHMITHAVSVRHNDNQDLVCISDDFCGGNVPWSVIALPLGSKPPFRLRGRRLAVCHDTHILLLAVPNCSRLRWTWIVAVVAASVP